MWVADAVDGSHQMADPPPTPPKPRPGPQSKKSDIETGEDMKGE
jgi:hypothetical protein